MKDNKDKGEEILDLEKNNNDVVNDFDEKLEELINLKKTIKQLINDKNMIEER